MSLLLAALEWIKGKRCEKLVTRIGNEVALSACVEVGAFKINVANGSVETSPS
jgi:hypothetical protein